MSKRQKVWLWVSAIVSMVVGLILVLNNSGAGWFFIVLGIIYIGTSTRASQGLTTSNPGLVRWGLFGVTILLILLAILVGIVLLV
jgi:hypothetical protein